MTRFAAWLQGSESSLTESIAAKRNQIALRKSRGETTFKQEAELRLLVNLEINRELAEVYKKKTKPRYRVPAICIRQLAREIGNPNHRAVK